MSATLEQHACLAETFDPITTERLAETGVTAGWRCLEIGTGRGTVAQWLAERVAPTGTVLATDLTARHGLTHSCLIHIEHDVVADELPDGEFDLITARLVLQVLPQRHEVLAKLVRALKPGGVLQLDELDCSHEQPLLAPDEHTERLYARFLMVKKIVMRARGTDPEFGGKLPKAMREAGLVDIDPRAYLLSRHPGSSEAQLQINHTHRMRNDFVTAGMSDEELEQVRALLNDPAFRATSGAMYSVQGRRR